MLNDIDPTTKQYIIFSLVIAIIVSFLINFILIEFIPNSPFYGFPFNLTNTQGLGNFIYRTIDTLVIAAFLTFPIYWGLMWFLKRAR